MTVSTGRRQALEEWHRFFSAEAHILRRWPLLLFQELANQPDHSLLAAAAEQYRRAERSPRPALRLLHKPKTTSACLATLVTGAPVRACSFSPDGERIVSGYVHIQIWDVRSGRELLRIAGHDRFGVTAVAFGGDGRTVVSSAKDGTLRIWDAETGRHLDTLAHSEQASREGVKGIHHINDFAISPDGARLAAAANDHTVHVWDLAGPSLERVLEGHSENVWCCDFSPDGRTILSGADDKMLKLWDNASGLETRTFAVGAWVRKCAFSPDGSRIALLAGGIQIRDAETGAQLMALARSVAGGPRVCAFSPDGERIVVAGFDGTVRLYDVSSGAELAVFERHLHEINDCCFSPDGRLILSASDDGTLKLWGLGAGQAEVTSQRGHLRSCAWSPDGSAIVTAALWDRTIRLWRPTGESVAALEGHQHEVAVCVWAAAGRWILSGDNNGTLKLWDAVGFREFASIQAHEHRITACALSPDSTCAVSASWDKTVKLWRLETGLDPITLHEDRDFATACAFSCDGRWIAAGCGGFMEPESGYPIRIWDSRSGILERALPGHKRGVTSCAFSPDSRWLLSSSSDGSIALWDVGTGRLVETLFAPGGVTSCAFSPDGKWIAGVGGDYGLRLWDNIGAGARVRYLYPHTDGICVAWSPDGRQLVTGAEAGKLHILEID